MSKSKTTEIADEVVDFLNAIDFEVSVTISRALIPIVKFEDLQTLQVIVIPRGRSTELLTRGKIEKKHKIEVGIQKKLSNPNDSDEVDPIGYFVEQVEESFFGVTLSGATCIEVENILADDSIYAKDHIYTDRVYTSVLVATFVEI